MFGVQGWKVQLRVHVFCCIFLFWFMQWQKIESKKIGLSGKKSFSFSEGKPFRRTEDRHILYALQVVFCKSADTCPLKSGRILLQGNGHFSVRPEDTCLLVQRRSVRHLSGDFFRSVAYTCSSVCGIVFFYEECVFYSSSTANFLRKTKASGTVTAHFIKSRIR